MTILRNASLGLARMIAVSLTLLPSPVWAEWRAAGDMPALIEELDLWLDLNGSLPRRAEPPDIQWINTGSTAGLNGPIGRSASRRQRGLYLARTQTIYLVRPWSSSNAQHVSVLLHELVHHRQAAGGYWYCPGAQELPAYRLQERWLGGQGLSGNINWLAVVMEAGCTPRDIHPD